MSQHPHQTPQTATPALLQAKATSSYQNAKKTRYSPRDARLLRRLLDAKGAPVDRMELTRHVGAANIPDKVMNARRRHGVTITTSYRKQIDRDGRPVEVGQYAIVGDQAQAKAREVLALLTGEA